MLNLEGEVTLGHPARQRELTMRRLDSKNFLRGFGRVVDLRGAITPRYSRKAQWIQNDTSAIAADWAAVFGDLSVAYYRVRRMKGSD